MAEAGMFEHWLEDTLGEVLGDDGGDGGDAHRAEESLNRLVESRAQDLQGRERVDRALAEGVRRNDLGRLRELRKAWARHHQSLGQLHSQLAEEHQQKALALMDEAGG